MDINFCNELLNFCSPDKRRALYTARINGEQWSCSGHTFNLIVSTSLCSCKTTKFVFHRIKNFYFWISYRFIYLNILTQLLAALCFAERIVTYNTCCTLQ